jgi:prepilin peptidase CpaA
MSVLLIYLPLLMMVACAAVIDARVRRIPNWLCLIVLLSGVGEACQGDLPVMWGMSLAGFALGFVLLFPAFALGAMGGGDVKLLAAIGAWTGPVGVIVVLVIASVAGMLIAVAQAARSGKFTALCKNSASLAVNFVHVRHMGVDHIQQQASGFHSIDKPLPYAVPMLAGLVGWVLAICI